MVEENSPSRINVTVQVEFLLSRASQPTMAYFTSRKLNIVMKLGSNIIMQYWEYVEIAFVCL